ncbi:MAG TPA: GDP-mannose 4,6 dehydratase [Clostridiales bacterium]|nr:GDP-mannose 4,6 dehydratase [Clostridiales bacterium]
MKALITGAHGFVGRYLAEELRSNGYEVSGTDIRGGWTHVDLLDFVCVKNYMQSERPGIIFHLAGQSAVGLSWKEPQMTFSINVNATLNLLDAARELPAPARVLLIGSGDEYGKTDGAAPIKETAPLKPETPYAVSKCAQEEMARLYTRAYGMDIVLTRSFNHTGPQQRRGFVVPDFASQIAAIEKGGDPVLKVGNLSAERDFSDVRDVARAYRLLAEKGRTGEIYNVGAGKACRIRDLLDILLSYAGRKIDVRQDAAKMRPVDVPVIVSDITKLQKDTGFAAEYTIEETLRDTLDYWRKQNES